MKKNFTADNEQTQKIAAAYQQLLASINDDVNREGLQKTPSRAAAAWQFLMQGYEIKLEEITSGALFTSDNDEMVLLKNIDLFSTCEHHLLPMIGRCHVAYLPQGKIIGLSKIPRIIDMFARRLQVQENLTVQIADCIQAITGALGVGVVIEAEHLCMVARGVEKKNIMVRTIATLGVLRSSEKSRQEFLTALN